MTPAPAQREPTHFPKFPWRIPPKSRENPLPFPIVPPYQPSY